MSTLSGWTTSRSSMQWQCKESLASGRVLVDRLDEIIHVKQPGLTGEAPFLQGRDELVVLHVFARGEERGGVPYTAQVWVVHDECLALHPTRLRAEYSLHIEPHCTLRDCAPLKEP